MIRIRPDPDQQHGENGQGENRTGKYQYPLVAGGSENITSIHQIVGSKDLQNVNITLRILYRPLPNALPNIYTTLGIDYDERVLPSITNEVENQQLKELNRTPIKLTYSFFEHLL